MNNKTVSPVFVSLMPPVAASFKNLSVIIKPVLDNL